MTQEFVRTGVAECTSEEQDEQNEEISAGSMLTFDKKDQYADVLASLAEMRYQKTLKQYNISFRSGIPFTNTKKRILHIVSQGDNLLYLLKVYGELQKEDTLFVDPDAEEKIQSKIVDIFEITCYTHLVVAHSGTSTRAVQEICSKIKSFLDRNPHKRVILIAKKEDAMAKQFKSMNRSYYKASKEDIIFTDFSKETRCRLLEKRVVLQGRQVQLEQLLAHSSEGDLIDMMDYEVLTKLVRNDPIEIGTKLKPLPDHYISRSIYYNDRIVPEEKLCQVKDYPEREVILIAGAAGMGKSSLLASMGMTIKEKYPNVWVIPIDLSSLTKSLRKLQDKSDTYISITELLDSDKATKFGDQFERNLFPVIEKVVLIDEICEVKHTYENTVLNLIRECRKLPSVISIFITTRPHLCEKLEQQLHVKSWTLRPLLEENQVDFLNSYWVKSLDLQREVKKKTWEYAQAVISNSKDTFTGNPLYMTMLAEVFREELRIRLEEWEWSKELLKKESKINLMELYKMFVKEKFLAKQKPEEKLKTYLQTLALTNIFDERNCALFNRYKKNRRDFPKQDSSTSNYPLHRTFAEYFVAKCVVKELKSQKQNNKFWNFLIEDVLYWNEYNGIRAFLDSFLDVMPHIMFKADNFISDGDKSLHILAKEGRYNILRLLFHCSKLTSQDLISCWKLESKMRRTDINILDVKNEFGYTALQEAAREGYLDVIKLLVEEGANINIKDEYGRTPLHYAAEDKRLDVIKCLVEEDADINSKDSESNTPLHVAARECHHKVVKFLVKHDADVNIQDVHGATILHFYTYSNNTDMVQFLLDKVDVDVNTKMNGGCTALHAAVFLENLDVVKLLVKHGADTNSTAITFPLVCGYLTRDSSYRSKWEEAIKIRMKRFTPLHIAAWLGSFGIVEYLIENGADVHKLVQEGNRLKTAVDVAKESGNSKVIRYLSEKSAKADPSHYITTPGIVKATMANCPVEAVNFNNKMNRLITRMVAGTEQLSIQAIK